MFLSKNARLSSIITTKQAKELIMQPAAVGQGCSDNQYIPTSKPAKTDNHIEDPAWRAAVSASVQRSIGAGRRSLNFI